MRLSECRRFLKRCAAWLWRMPHRAGYGVHSPYAFQFIRGVVLEREAYYAYKALAAHRAGAALSERDDQLLFRLVNFVQPRLTVSIGSLNPVTKHYLQTACQASRYVSLNSAADLQAVGNEEIGFLLCDLQDLADLPAESWLSRLSEQAAEGGLFCFLNIDASPNAQRLWHQLRALPAVRLSFDLYRIGLLSFERRLSRQDYIVRRW
ncbi:MAG: hypothetical protein IKR63_02305 [Alloprevotella sp.]|nr:hypothetical protein [Alloprevotella sp.]